MRKWPKYYEPINIKIRTLSLLKLLKFEKAKWSYFCHFCTLIRDMACFLFCPLDIRMDFFFVIFGSIIDISTHIIIILGGGRGGPELVRS